MNIPSGLGDLNDLKRRAKKAFRNSDLWQDTLDDAYDYFLPQRNLFDTQAKGQKKMDKIFDSTALDAIQQAASKLQENIAPIWSRWANFEPSQSILKLIEESGGEVSEKQVRENLEEQAEITFDYINRSNFGTQFYEMALDLLVGTGTLMIDEVQDDDVPLSFGAIPQNGLGFEEGPNGSIQNHWRAFKVKARNIESTWPGFQVSSSLAQTIKDSPDEDVKLTQGVVFHNKSYHAIVWVDDEDSVSWVANLEDSSPWVTGRYAKAAGELRGRGPALQVLPDVKTLNKAKEFSLTKAAIDLSGIWTSVSDSVINPYSIKIAPGVVIPVGSNSTQNPTLARLNTDTNLDLAVFEIEQLQASIRRALFVDLREPSDAVVSATQYAMEARELAKRIGSAFGRLQTEVLIPTLKRVYWILKRRGLVQPLKIGGEEVSIKFMSPLARAQDAEDLLSVQQAVEFTIAAAGPAQAQMAYKLEDFGQYAAKKTGMPQELVRDEAEKTQVIEAGAAAAREQNDLGQNTAA